MYQRNFKILPITVTWCLINVVRNYVKVFRENSIMKDILTISIVQKGEGHQWNLKLCICLHSVWMDPNDLTLVTLSIHVWHTDLISDLISWMIMMNYSDAPIRNVQHWSNFSLTSLRKVVLRLIVITAFLNAETHFLRTFIFQIPFYSHSPTKNNNVRKTKDTLLIQRDKGASL